MENDNAFSASDPTEWKKPCDIMKKIRTRKKKNLPARTLSASQRDVFSSKSNNCNKQNRPSNPFAKRRAKSESAQITKKRILSLAEPPAVEIEQNVHCKNAGNSYHSFFTTVASECSVYPTAALEEQTGNLSNSDLGLVYLNEDSIQGVFTEATNEPEPEKEGSHDLPTDWSIKTKARFLSPSSFAWCARMKVADEARLIVKATRCTEVSVDVTTSQSELRTELGKHLVYWQQPVVPWMSLYPRYGADCKLLAHGSTETIINDNMKACLYDNWAASFRSIYQLLREDLCPYFYVCAQMYTALFRSRSASCNHQAQCIVTPTSLGFRNSLKSEGIEFTMPLQERKSVELSKQEQKTDHNSADLHDDDDDKENDFSSQEDLDAEDELTWKTISDGLQLRQSREITSAVTTDGSPRTCVLVQGASDVQLLFNFLLNCRSSISTSGPQTGFPPTILSPNPFLGATLKKLEYRAGIARTVEETPSHGGNSPALKHNFSLDVTGPLMPHHLHGLVALLSKTQEKGEYSAAFGARAYTTPFNVNPRENTGVKTNLEKNESEEHCDTLECGLSPDCMSWSADCMRWFASKTSNQTIRQLNTKQGMYKCPS